MQLPWMVCWWSYRTWSRFEPICQTDLCLFHTIQYTLHAHVQVEKMHDEGVQLKVLQTALTLMQSTTLAQNEVNALAFNCK